MSAPSSPVPSAMTQAAALRVAFPEYVVNVRMGWRDKPRFEVVSRAGGDPYCLISSDAQEIWRELRGVGGAELSGRLVQGVERGWVEGNDWLGAQMIAPGLAADGGAVDVNEACFGGPGAAAVEHQEKGLERVLQAWWQRGGSVQERSPAEGGPGDGAVRGPASALGD